MRPTHEGFEREDQDGPGTRRTSIDSEKHVVGACLEDVSGGTFDEVVALVKSRDFAEQRNVLVFEMIGTLRSNGIQADSMTVACGLDEAGRSKVFGPSPNAALHYCIHELEACLPSNPNARYHAQRVADLARVRDLADACQMTLVDCDAQSGLDTDQVQDRAEARLYEVLSHEVDVEGAFVEDTAAGRASTLLALQDGGLAPGLETGIDELDYVMKGLIQPKELIVVAARPSVGKSALAQNMAEHVARYFGAVTFISLEMSQEEVEDRLFASVSRVDLSKVQGWAKMTPFDRRMFQASVSRVESLPLWIGAPRRPTMGQIASLARRHRARHGTKMLFVDYLQLIESDDADTRRPRHEQVAQISRRLKGLARELSIPVIALSQLNRASEARADHKPSMSELRESGAIEQDADRIILIHRPERHDPNNKPGIAELIVEKNRNGDTGTVEVAFVKHICRFESLSRKVSPEELDPDS